MSETLIDATAEADRDGDTRLDEDDRLKPEFVAEVIERVDAGAGVKDACAEVIAENPGAPSRRELYDAVLRARR